MTLAAPLARALDEPDDTLTRGPWDNGAYVRRVCDRLRADPETLAALAEALHAVWPKHVEGMGGTGLNVETRTWWVTDPALPSDQMAAALADALFGQP